MSLKNFKKEFKYIFLKRNVYVRSLNLKKKRNLRKLRFEKVVSLIEENSSKDFSDYQINLFIEMLKIPSSFPNKRLLIDLIISDTKRSRKFVLNNIPLKWYEKSKT